MAVLTEGIHAGEFIISEANGTRSRGTGTILLGQDLEAGTILGKVTVDGKYVLYDPLASDGSDTVAGILFDDVDATDADKVNQVLVLRDVEVNGDTLTYSDGADDAAKAAANLELEALGIIVR